MLSDVDMMQLVWTQTQAASLLRRLRIGNEMVLSGHLYNRAESKGEGEREAKGSTLGSMCAREEVCWRCDCPESPRLTRIFQSSRGREAALWGPPRLAPLPPTVSLILCCSVVHD